MLMLIIFHDVVTLVTFCEHIPEDNLNEASDSYTSVKQTNNGSYRIHSCYGPNEIQLPTFRLGCEQRSSLYENTWA